MLCCKGGLRLERILQTHWNKCMGWGELPARKVPGAVRRVRQYWRGRSGHLPLETLLPITEDLEQSGRAGNCGDPVAQKLFIKLWG